MVKLAFGELFRWCKGLAKLRYGDREEIRVFVKLTEVSPWGTHEEVALTSAEIIPATYIDNREDGSFDYVPCPELHVRAYTYRDLIALKLQEDDRLIDRFTF
jgi:hypothetical protein